MQGPSEFGIDIFMSRPPPNRELEVAPPALARWKKTNFGLIQTLPSPRSFVLNRALKIPIGKDYLFLPEL